MRGTILSSTANATGVLGTAHSGNGFVFRVTGSSGSQEGAGVYGVNFAFGGDGGSGVLGYAGATAGPVWGVKGYANSTDGIGVQGSAPFEGLVGVAQTCKTTCLPTAGTAGVFTTGSGGNIVVGNVADVNNNLTPVFRVDSTGKGFFDGGTQTGGADFAESMAIAGPKNHYEPGDLLAVDSSANRQLTLTTQPYSTLVAGIYSTKPGVLASTHKMKSSESEEEIPLAVVGIVPGGLTVVGENEALVDEHLSARGLEEQHVFRDLGGALLLGRIVDVDGDAGCGRSGGQHVVVGDAVESRAQQVRSKTEIGRSVMSGSASRASANRKPMSAFRCCCGRRQRCGDDLQLRR